MIKSIVNYFSSIVMATVVLKSVPGSNQYWETRVTELFGDYFMLARIYLVFFSTWKAIVFQLQALVEFKDRENGDIVFVCW